MIQTEFERLVDAHPNMTLKEYVAYQEEEKRKAREAEQYNDDCNKIWMIENLVGKNLLFRMNGGFRIMRCRLDESHNEICFDIIYTYGSIEKMLDGTGDIYRFVQTNARGEKKPPFNIKWIKTPYNNSRDTFSVYVISDEKMNEISDTFGKFSDFFRDMTKFESADFVEKVY